MRRHKKWIGLSLIIILILSNIIWLNLYIRKHNELKYALIPSLEKDYFTTQKILATYQMKRENYQIHLFNPIFELKLGQEIPYNLYFNTKEEYEDFRKEKANQKNVSLILQNPDYPNGCESASAVMLLNYIGVDVTLKEFINDYLEKNNVYEKEGKRFGPDPSKIYAGDPSSRNRGWGAFEPVIAKSMIKILEDYHLQKELVLMLGEANKSPLYVLAANEYPSIIWITMDYQKAENIYEWFSYDEKYTYTYPKNSHTVLLTGMDEEYYYINDPLKEEKNYKVPKEQLEESFNSMGRQFISFSPI